MIRIGVAGGRGYVGAELLKLLDQHPSFETVYAASSSQSGQPVLDIDKTPLASGLLFSPLEQQPMLEAKVDVWVIAQSNGKAALWVAALESSGARFLDISFDFRFDSEWVYGLPERNADRIRGADRVANPGCYATAVQLALMPIIDQVAGVPVAFGVSGFSGAGRSPGPRNDPQRLQKNLMPYSLVDHGHQREISHQLGQPVRFLPHVAEFFRGISVTVDVPLTQATDAASLIDRYREYYRAAELIHVNVDIPEIAQIRNQPGAIVGGFAVAESGDRVAIVAVIDNLLKGAASQAIQNLELMTV